MAAWRRNQKRNARQIPKTCPLHNSVAPLCCDLREVIDWRVAHEGFKLATLLSSRSQRLSLSFFFYKSIKKGKQVRHHDGTVATAKRKATVNPSSMCFEPVVKTGQQCDEITVGLPVSGPGPTDYCRLHKSFSTARRASSCDGRNPMPGTVGHSPRAGSAQPLVRRLLSLGPLGRRRYTVVAGEPAAPGLDPPAIFSFFIFIAGGLKVGPVDGCRTKGRKGPLVLCANRAPSG